MEATRGPESGNKKGASNLILAGKLPSTNLTPSIRTQVFSQLNPS
jgi:hypothetical protein